MTDTEGEDPRGVGQRRSSVRYQGLDKVKGGESPRPPSGPQGGDDRTHEGLEFDSMSRGGREVSSTGSVEGAGLYETRRLLSAGSTERVEGAGLYETRRLLSAGSTERVEGAGLYEKIGRASCR